MKIYHTHFDLSKNLSLAIKILHSKKNMQSDKRWQPSSFAERQKFFFVSSIDKCNVVYSVVAMLFTLYSGECVQDYGFLTVVVNAINYVNKSGIHFNLYLPNDFLKATILINNCLLSKRFPSENSLRSIEEFFDIITPEISSQDIDEIIYNLIKIFQRSDFEKLLWSLDVMKFWHNAVINKIITGLFNHFEKLSTQQSDNIDDITIIVQENFEDESWEII